MKKLIGMILALVMVFSLSVTAMAAEGSWDGSVYTGDNTQNVTATYSDEATTEVDVYSVQIEWQITGNLTYSAGTKTYTWVVTDDPATDDVDEALTWKEQESGKGWTGTANIAVTITNKSSEAVTASVADTPSVAGATVDWTDYTSGTGKTIDSAAKNIQNYTGTGVAQTLSLSGSIDSSNITGTIASNGATVSTITVTLTHE